MESISKYSAIPPQIPAMRRSVVDRINFLCGCAGTPGVTYCRAPQNEQKFAPSATSCLQFVQFIQHLLERHHLPHDPLYIFGLRKNFVFELGVVRAERIFRRDTANGAIEVVKQLFADARGNFRTISP